MDYTFWLASSAACINHQSITGILDVAVGGSSRLDLRFAYHGSQVISQGDYLGAEIL